jgi:hypothetical protein
VKSRLSSYRFRRRLYWSAGILGTLAVLVGVSIKVGNTGRSSETKIDRTKKAWVYHEPASMKLTAADRRELYTTAVRFISTAVARKRLDAAWEMLGPEMKAGQTRKSWDSGFNNVIPFPAVGIATWNILYSYENDVAMDLAVIGAKNSDYAGKTFTLELKRARPHRWLVAAWVPKGIGGRGQVKSAASRPVPPPPTAALSPKWLLAPLVFITFSLLFLTALGVRNLVRHRRAARRYADVLRSS